MLTGMDLIRSKPGLMSALSSALGITRAAVNKWTQVPEGRLRDVSRITGLSLEALRPDLVAQWREMLQPVKGAASPPDDGIDW